MPKKWLAVSIAPFESNLEVCVIDGDLAHAPIFACRRSATIWVDATRRSWQARSMAARTAAPSSAPLADIA
jgi:hypothetical protein